MQDAHDRMKVMGDSPKKSSGHKDHDILHKVGRVIKHGWDVFMDEERQHNEHMDRQFAATHKPKKPKIGKGGGGFGK